MRLYLFLFSLICSFSFANEKIPDFKITEVEKGIFLHKSYKQVEGWGLVSSNGLVVVSKGKAFIVDTPWSESDTEKLLAWIRSKNYELMASVSTHSHDDRTAGLEFLNENSISTYTSALTDSILKKEGKERARHVVVGGKFKLMDGLLEVYYPGAGHTIDNLVVWLPESKVLFGGCFIRSLASKALGYTGEAKIDQWPESAENVRLKYSDAKIVVPGHGRIGSLELVDHTKALAESALAENAPTEKALDESNQPSR